MLASGSEGGQIDVWKISTGQILRKFEKAHSKVGNCVCIFAMLLPATGYPVTGHTFQSGSSWVKCGYSDSRMLFFLLKSIFLVEMLSAFLDPLRSRSELFRIQNADPVTKKIEVKILVTN